MGLKTRKAANSKKKNRAPEAIQPDDAQVTRPKGTPSNSAIPFAQ